jgi:hypothetical protein
MAVVPRIALPEFFRAFSPTYVLGTTYTVSLAFFEALVFPEIDCTRLRRCLLLCDRAGFQRALVEASALRQVGREYMAVCAQTPHSFHPKVWLMIRDEEAALLVGSGNLTQSGFMTNLELFDAVRLTRGGPHRTLAGDILRFLAGLGGLWSGTGRDGLLVSDTLAEMQEALERLGEGMSGEEPGGTRFLTNFGGPLMDQLFEFFEGGTLYAAAPYFGGSTAALQSLRQKLDLRRLKVFPALHAGEALDVPLEELAAIPGASAHRLALSTSYAAFTHLKLYGCDGPKGCWLFTTSANCTESALGGRNVEAGLLRPVSRSALRTYFTEDPEGVLPGKQRMIESRDSTRWLTLTATNRGTGLEVVAVHSPAAWLPLGGVRLTLQLGGQAYEWQTAALFARGSAERIPWAWFPEVHDPTGGSPLLKLQATAADGAPVEGAAFVDQPLLLTSEPVHRSAWRATLAILDREGLPEASDLACVFHLVEELFHPAADVSGDETTSVSASARRAREEVDKTPIWPPVSDDFVPHHLHTGREQTVQWFQKILAELLGRTQAATSALSSAPIWAEGEEEAGAGAPATPPVLRRATRSVWGQAAASYERLIEQLNSMRITADSARKIWPVSVAILLVTLATRRQIVRCVADAEVPPVTDLVGRFLLALFADRWQVGRHGVDDDWIGQTDPSVAAVLHEGYATRPMPDIAGILRLLYAFQHPHHLFLDGWLLFREITPEAITEGPPPEEYTTLYRRYLTGESGGLDWPQVAASWEALARLGWADHPGFQELAALARQAGGADGKAPPLPHLRDLWQQTERRIRSGEPWRFTVSRLERCCKVQNCPLSYCMDPAKRALAQLRPVICKGCGSVLVPDRLAQAFGEWK